MSLLKVAEIVDEPSGSEEIESVAVPFTVATCDNTLFSDLKVTIPTGIAPLVLESAAVNVTA